MNEQGTVVLDSGSVPVNPPVPKDVIFVRPPLPLGQVGLRTLAGEVR